MRRELIPRGLRWGLLVSVIAHLAVVVLFVAAHRAEPRARRFQNVLTTKLVRLGKKRPPELLPRKPAEPSANDAPIESEPAAVEAPPSASSGAAAKSLGPSARMPTPTDAATAQRRLAEMTRVHGALDRIRKRAEEESEGDPSGVPGGEVTELTRAIIGNKFATEVYHCLKSHYAVEGIDAEKLVGRKATVLVRVANDGSFLDWQIEVGSELPVFDLAVERAVKGCSKVSPPDPAIRDQVYDDGIEIVFES